MATKQTAPKGTDFAALIQDYAGRAEATQAKLVAFGNDNLAALKASAEIGGNGIKPLVALATENARTRYEALQATLARAQGVTSPGELLRIQAEAGKSAFAEASADARAFGQAVADLARDAYAPLRGRFDALTKLAA